MHQEHVLVAPRVDQAHKGVPQRRLECIDDAAHLGIHRKEERPVGLIDHPEQAAVPAEDRSTHIDGRVRELQFGLRLPVQIDAPQGAAAFGTGHGEHAVGLIGADRQRLVAAVGERVLLEQQLPGMQPGTALIAGVIRDFGAAAWEAPADAHITVLVGHVIADRWIGRHPDAHVPRDDVQLLDRREFRERCAGHVRHEMRVADQRFIGLHQHRVRLRQRGREHLVLELSAGHV